jgi:hypothetical protein
MASNPIFSLLWLILLWFLAWPVAFLCAWLWVMFMVRLEIIMRLARLASSPLITQIPSLCSSALLPLKSHSRLAVRVSGASTKPSRISPNGQWNAATRLRIAAQLALPPNHGVSNLVVAVMVFVQVEKCGSWWKYDEGERHMYRLH